MASRTSAGSRRAFPVTVTQLPVVRCAECGQTMAHRPGQASSVLTQHYERVHAAALQS